jgi:serine/threonine protein kinase
MEVYCTRPGCPHPQNYFPDLDDNATLRTVQQKYCTSCGMPLILVGRYLPIKLLGRGGFGAAFLARDRYTPGMRQCVVKQFQPAGDLTPTQFQLAQDLFEREAIVLEDIGNQHDQIPDLFAYFPLPVPGLQPGHQDQFFYLVQEYIDGQDLEHELAQKGKLSEDEVVEILREILKVLTFVHGQNIIHRDIKPSNIMRHRNGKLFLLDFGAVKQVTNAPSGGAGSSTGIYSLGFAPPEQMSGSQVFPSTDLYALAVTAIILLTGEQDIAKLFDAYRNQWNWHPLVNVSPHLTKILDKMLLPAANQRYQSAQEVLDALDSPLVPVVPAPNHSSQPPVLPPPQLQSLPTQLPPQKHSIQRFSTLQLLVGSAFTGFEGGLIALALWSILNSPIPTLGISAAIVGILILGLWQRWIEKPEMLVTVVVSSAIMYFLPLLRGGLNVEQVAILAVATGLVAIAVTALFRLIYKLLSLLL